ncbi:MAG: ABC transporter permease [Terracidiphilus sp.]|jgi:putative ABC transport system permease protein
MHGVAKDFRFAFRQLWKAPGFTLIVVLMLGLGIGITTAIFSLIEGILLRPLAFSNPDRLVLVGDHLGNNSGIGVTAREIATYAHASGAFSSMGGFTGASYELSGGATPEEVSAGRLTAGVFPTLGVEPILGRIFTQQEEDAHEPLAVISYALWMNRYQRDPNVIGRSLELNRKVYSIIGVMPRSFEFPVDSGRLNQTQLWVPMSLTSDELSEQAAGFWGYRIVARLKEDVSEAAAAQDASRVAQQIMRNFPPTMSTLRIRGDAKLLNESVVGQTRPLLRTLFLAVSIVLLIACVNVAILLLVRAIRRRRECAIRLALGARPGVLVRESLCEGILLSLAGGVLGLAFAATVLRMALHFLPDSMPRIHSISLDGPVAAFALLVALATGVLCSIAPAFAAARTDLIESLKDGVRTGGSAKSHSWLRSTLVVAEIAIALVLLTTAGALLRSYQRMLAVDPGYRADHVLVAGYQLPLDQYPTDASVNAFHRAVLERLSHKPGVVAAAFTNILPASDSAGMSAYTLEGQSAATWKLKFASFGTIEGDYFRSLGIPLLQGRMFTTEDRADAPLVIIVNPSMAEHSWPGQSALGKRMHVGNPRKGLPWATVVGVVGNTKIGARDEPDSDQWFAPDTQPAILYGQKSSWKLAESAGGYITLRSALPPDQMRETLRATIAEIDPLLALQHLRTMSDIVSESEAPRRFNTGIISAFALVALALAVTGIYAVVAFSVSLRTQEIAIRMALGAQRKGIARLVLFSAIRLALVGCAFGVLASFAVSQVVTSFLFDVTATNPAIYAGSVLIMLLVALLASVLPASRAASADPIQALRAI